MKGRLWLVIVGVVALLSIVVHPIFTALAPAPAGVRVVLWHSQRGAEKATLEALLREFNEENAGRVYVEPLAVPEGSFKDKVLRTVPRGGGPDVFLRPHNELGEYLQDGVVRAVDPAALPYAQPGYLKGILEGVSREDRRYGFPLTYKSLLVFYNRELLPNGPPRTLEEVRALRSTLPAGTYPLAYEANLFFFHAPFFLAYGGSIFDGPDERFAVFDDPRSFRLPGQLRAEGTLPPDPSYNEAIRLFEARQAALIICGPWYTPGGAVAEAKAWDVAPLFQVEGRPTGSFVTVEAAFLSASTAHPDEAEAVARFLAGPRGQKARYQALSLPPVAAAEYERDGGGEAASLAQRLVTIQRGSLEAGAVTPSTTKMGAVWRPGDDVLKASVAGRNVDEAIEGARYGLSRIADKRLEGGDARVYGVLLTALLVLGTVLVIRRIRSEAASPVAARARLTGFWGASALPYLAPGVVASAVLVIAPIVTGAGMSLFEYQAGKFVFVGTQNFREILAPPLERAFEARSFYFALGVTVLWTLLNVLLHVSIGVVLALLLRPSYLRFRTLYRLVLILPWAIPNYITALMWKGMFHAQVGAINALLAPFGFAGKTWFDSFGTAFFANLVTNTWLGFPFMMVVTLGALSAIPRELEEASVLDGASRWQRFVHIVLPHIRPALLPSIILGSVWTFNMFNVVYLVSGGEPGSQTDILVSEAYRWAFERGQRYGYAAAYSVLIFVFLLLYGRVTKRLDPEAA